MVKQGSPRITDDTTQMKLKVKHDFDNGNVYKGYGRYISSVDSCL